MAVLVENAPGGESGSAGGRDGAGGAPWVQPLGRWELLADPSALEELAASAQARRPPHRCPPHYSQGFAGRFRLVTWGSVVP